MAENHIRSANDIVPTWAKQPFGDFFNLIEEMQRVTSLAVAGIAITREMPKWVDALGPDGRDSRDYEARREGAAATAQLASREIERGYPHLHAMFVVALWSALESLANNLLVAWLINDRVKVFRHERLKTLKVPVGEYGQLSHEDQAHYLARLIDKMSDAPLKDGVTRFDSVLDMLGLDGPLDGETRDAVFELGQVRNVIVHRGGIVDRIFVEKCPWMSRKMGDRLTVTRDAAARYFGAAIEYAASRLERTFVAFGVAAPPLAKGP